MTHIACYVYVQEPGSVILYCAGAGWAAVLLQHNNKWFIQTCSIASGLFLYKVNCCCSFLKTHSAKAPLNWHICTEHWTQCLAERAINLFIKICINFQHLYIFFFFFGWLRVLFGQRIFELKESSRLLHIRGKVYIFFFLAD